MSIKLKLGKYGRLNQHLDVKQTSYWMSVSRYEIQHLRLAEVKGAAGDTNIIYTVETDYLLIHAVPTAVCYTILFGSVVPTRWLQSLISYQLLTYSDVIISY